MVKWSFLDKWVSSVKCFQTNSLAVWSWANWTRWKWFISHPKDLPVQSKATCFLSQALIVLLKVSIKLQEQMHPHIPHICDCPHVRDPCGVFEVQTDAAPEDPGTSALLACEPADLMCKRVSGRRLHNQSALERYQQRNCSKAELLPFDNAKMKGEDEEWLLIDGPLICSNPNHTMQSNGVQRGAKGLMFFGFLCRASCIWRCLSHLCWGGKGAGW